MSDHDPFCYRTTLTPTSSHLVTCICEPLRLARADERERIAQELAVRELTARALAGQYFEGARDAFDEAEQIARADRR